MLKSKKDKRKMKKKYNNHKELFARLNLMTLESSIEESSLSDQRFRRQQLHNKVVND